MSAFDPASEQDAFGPVEIAADRHWGAQTQRALAIFDVGEERFPACLIHAFGLQKIAAARANRRLGVLDATRADAIEAAAMEVCEGRFDDHFPLTIWQTGSGTQTNMNANEVIANRANELLGQPLGTKAPVHPNDHVNCSQSSNDSFPTVMHICTALELRDRLFPALWCLQDELAAKADAFADAVKIGRTHLMDAVPMTMGQAFDAFARQIGNGIARIETTLPRLNILPQGGTAIGTGLNAPAGFDVAFCEDSFWPLAGSFFRRTPANSRAWPRTTRWSRFPAPSVIDLQGFRCSRLPTTSGYWDRARAAASASW